MTDDTRRSRIAFLRVGVIAPLGILALAAAVIIAWMPELPDPMAIHWGSGGADGFATPWGYVAGVIGIGIAVVILLAVLTLSVHRLPQSSTKPPIGPWSSTARFLGAMNLGTGTMIAFLAVAGAALQRGLADAADAGDIGGWAVLGLVLLVAAAALGWFLQPAPPAAPAGQGAPAGSIPLAPNERAAWFGTATMARGGVIALTAALVLLATTTVFWAARGEDAWWILALVTVLTAVLVGTMLVFRVRVNAQGMRARSLLGWPDNRIPLDRIDRVEVVHLDPFREFGGWGWRLAVDGRRGIVLRAGEALQITRTDRRVFVVTVDGASDAAAVLETLRTHTAHD
jgi:uncharacterized membrane protein